MARLRLKTDIDQRMIYLSAGTQIFIPEKDIQKLTRGNLDHYIEELRKGETAVRRLRGRLEALRDGIDRPCPVCSRPVVGRADAIYCTPECRLRAHRARND